MQLMTLRKTTIQIYSVTMFESLFSDLIINAKFHLLDCYWIHGAMCPLNTETEKGQQCKHVKKYISHNIFASKIPGLA